jgi:ATP-dependent Clp protease ATP-binding subunit ClpC
MPTFDFEVTAIIRELENGLFLGELLWYPEFVRLAASEARLRVGLEKCAVAVTKRLEPVALHRRHGAGEPVLGAVTVSLAPPERSLAWHEPIDVAYNTVSWRHGDTRIAFVPELGVEVVARGDEDFDDLVRSHVRAVAMNRKISVSLERLALTHRTSRVHIERLTVSVKLPTPKQAAAKALVDEGKEKSVLEQVATDLVQESNERAYEVDDLVERVAAALAGRNPRSVLLVGPSGAGKTAVVRELARRRTALGLGRTPFWSTSGSRIVAGMTGYGMWQDRCRKLWSEASKERAVLHLGSLVELEDVGKSVSSTQGVASFLRTFIARGDVLAIAECTPEQIPYIERTEPRLLDAFHRIDVDEPSVEKGLEILRRSAEALAATRAPVRDDAVALVDRLHRRYATYSAFPGRPLRFLKNLAADADRGERVGPGDVVRAFARETGLPLFLLDDDVAFDGARAREFFEGRVLGQPDAVGLVLDLLATTKAGLARRRKPIASLLFVGPTGVGKTEMARTLAEFFFDDRERLVRFDMSEYADALAVARLVGDSYSAEGLLTSRVREQPFSVVLFDEVEKSHHAFFDLLLQILGEGRLTDGAGRLADFCNSVVVMTSNLGAESFRGDAPGFGERGDATLDAARHFTSEVRAFVRPELFNRIDHIVPFAPLGEGVVLGIARRELDRVARRDGVLYRGLKLTIEDEAVALLARKGFDARYGARPLKRVLEREVLAPLAEALNGYAASVALAAALRADGERIRVDVRALAGDMSSSDVDRTAVLLAARWTALRRSAQDLEGCATTRELDNDIYRLERLERSVAKRKWPRPEEAERLARLPEMRGVAAAVRSLSAAAARAEDEALLAVYGREPIDLGECEASHAGAREEWRRLVFALYALGFKRPDRATVGVFGGDADGFAALVRAYLAIAETSGASTHVVRFALTPDAKRRGAPFERLTVRDAGVWLSEPDDATLGAAIEISGPLAFPRFEGERGRHDFVVGQKTHHCLVAVSEDALADFAPPPGVERRLGFPAMQPRRTYELARNVLDDTTLGKRLTWTGRSLTPTLRSAVEDALWREASALCVCDR